MIDAKTNGNLGPSYLEKVQADALRRAAAASRKDERDRISRRIQSLRSKQKNVGTMRQAGIQLSIASLKAELRELSKPLQ